MEGKTPSETAVEMNQLVLPNDTNLLGNLLGGKLMHWIDIAGALAATKHARNAVSTILVDSVEFKHPARQGELVELQAKLTWVGRTSMEVKVKVYAENLKTGQKIMTSEAYVVFVAVDENEKPIPVPPLIPETEEEKIEYEKARIRRENRIKKFK